MKANKYTIVTRWSDEDNGFIATCPEFPNLATFGKSQKKAAAEAQSVLEDFLEIIAEDGATPPQPQKYQEYSGQTRLRIPKTLHKELAESAEYEGMSLNAYMVNSLQQHQSAKDGAKEVAKEVAKSVSQVISHQKELFTTIGMRLNETDDTAPQPIDAAFYLQPTGQQPTPTFIKRIR